MISFAAEQRFIVTGASSGIGRGVALLLNELGATVIGIGRNEERLQAMKEKARFPENVFLEQKDLVEDIAGLPSYVKQLREKYGKFQGMAYCAGVGELQPLRAVDLPAIHSLFDVNYFAPVFMAKGFADPVVSITDGKVDVVINATTLTDPERAQIEDIVKRKTEVTADNIVITLMQLQE